MKQIKKLLAVVLSLAMVLGTFSVTALAATIGGTNQVIYASGDYILSNNIYGSSGIALTVNSGVTATVDVGSYQIYNNAMKNAAITNNGNLTVTSTSKYIYNYSGGSGATAATINIIDGKVTLTAGTKIAKVTSAAKTIPVEGKTVIWVQAGGEVDVNGAEVAGNIKLDVNNVTYNEEFSYYENPGTITDNITSGWFYNDLTDYCADGYECVEMTAEQKTAHPGCLYTVQEKQAVEPVAEVTISGTTTQYETFDAAIADAAEEGGTVKLLADCEKTYRVTTIPADIEVILDLAGHNLTNTYTNSNITSTNHRYFTVAGTLNITDSVGGGTMTANAEYTGNASITFCQATGTINIDNGIFFSGAAQTATSNVAFSRAAGGTYSITGGWYTEDSYCGIYTAEGYGKVIVTDESKVSAPITVSNTYKTFNYSKNAADATGQVESSMVYYLDGYTVDEILNTRTNQFSYSGYSFMGWSTDADANPDSAGLIGAGDVIDWTSDTYGETTTFYAIWKEVDESMWVCVNTNDTTQGYASIAAAFADGCSDVTLIKNCTNRENISSGSGRLNLNGYNIVPNSADNPTGSALVIKTAISIYNEVADTITFGGATYNFGGEGRIEGYAQGTGGAIDANGSSALVKIYGGTFTGDAPNHGTVLTCSSGGQYYIYGGTFTPANSESEISAYYTGAGSIFVLGGILDGSSQSDVKMTGTWETYSEKSGTVGIAGGYFSEIPSPIAGIKVGSWDAVGGVIVEDSNLAVVNNTNDETYPYSVGATPWYITYELNDGRNSDENPIMVAKDDETFITLQPATKTGYTFAGWTDADGNAITTITGSGLAEGLTLTANFTAIEYTITYNNLCGATISLQTTFTIEDNVTLGTSTRSDYYLLNWTEGSEAGGADITGWNAGEKTENINVYANWSSAEASVKIGEEGTEVGYKNFTDAITAAVAAAAKTDETVTVKLYNDVTINERLDLGENVDANYVFDLNGKTINETTYTNHGLAVYRGSLTITGDGTIIDNKTAGHSIVCQRAEATLTIENGTFTGFTKSTTNASSAEDMQGAGAVIVAGTFSFDPTDEIKEGSKTDDTSAPYTVYVKGPDKYCEIVSIGGQISDTLQFSVYVNSNMETLEKLSYNTGTHTNSVEAEECGGIEGVTHVYQITGIQIGFIAKDLDIKIGDKLNDTKIKSVLDYYNVLANNIMQDSVDEREEALLNLLADTVKFGYELSRTDEEHPIFDLSSWVTQYKTNSIPAKSVKRTTVSAVNPANYLIRNASVRVSDRAALMFKVYASDTTDDKVVLRVNDNTYIISIATDGVAESGTNEYLVVLEKINPFNYNDTVNVELLVDGQVVHAVNYSVESYCTAMQSKSIEVGDTTAGILALSLYRFGKSFVTYKEF